MCVCVFRACVILGVVFILSAITILVKAIHDLVTKLQPEVVRQHTNTVVRTLIRLRSRTHLELSNSHILFPHWFAQCWFNIDSWRGPGGEARHRIHSGLKLTARVKQQTCKVD